MSNNLPILAIETSGSSCSVALLVNETEYIENTFNRKHVHSQKLLIMIEGVLKSVDIKLNDLAHIAVSIGPGSFTGLRIGLSAAKGLALGAGLPIVAVPTFDAFALEINQFMNTGSEFIIANNVNSEEVYYSKVETKLSNYNFIEKLQIIAKNKLESKAKNLPVFGNSVNKSGFLSSPSAKFVAQWSYLFGKELLSFDYDFLEPLYLKKFIPKVKNEKI